MQQHFQRQSQKPKPNTDMCGVHNRKKSVFVSINEEEDLQLKTLQMSAKEHIGKKVQKAEKPVVDDLVKQNVVSLSKKSYLWS